MSGGGKGGSTTSQVQIPAWLENAAQQNLARADRVAQIGYTPYFGPDVAAFTPMQEAAMNNTNQAALSFGMAAPTSAMAGIPAAQTFAGGVQGYSSAPLYQQSVEALRTNAPGQYDAMSQMFVDPITGAQPLYPFGTGVAPGSPAAPPAAPPVGPQGFDWTQDLSGGVGGSNGFVSTGPNSMSGGAEDRRNAAMQAGTFGGGAEERRNAGVQSGTGSFGLPDPMRGGFAGTNLPGRVGGIVNALSGANRPNEKPPAVKATTKTAPAKAAPSKSTSSPSKSKSSSKDSGARR